MSNHTPGPWELGFAHDKVTRRPNVAEVRTANGEIIHRADLDWHAQEDAERFAADARLIAAAPELLQALAEITTAFRHAVAANVDLPGFDPESHGLIKQARAAIAKAEGAAS